MRLIFVMLSLGIGHALGCGAPTTVVHTGGSDRNYGLTVTGTAEVKAKPDIAKITLGVEIRAVTATTAEQQANRQMQAMITAVKSLGIEDKDLQTTNYSINYEQEYPGQPYPGPVMDGEESVPSDTVTSSKPSKEPERAASMKSLRGYYRVNHQLHVTVRRLSKLGTILSAATQAGANHIWGISFELDDPAPLESQARDKAMADAKSRANTLAKLSGATLGPILAISEGSGDRVYPRMAMEAQAFKASDRSSVPIEQGEIVIMHQIQLTYALK